MRDTLFSLSYFKYEVEDWGVKKKEFFNLLEESPQERDEMNFYSSSRRSKNKICLERFSNLIFDQLKKFANELHHSIKIDDVWSVTYHSNDHQTAHNHGSSGYSGVLYLDFDSHIHESTHFICPWNIPENDSTYIFTPDITEGDIFIFPSFIRHFCPPNKNSKERTIISFDVSIINN